MALDPKNWKNAPEGWQPGDPLPPDATPLDSDGLKDLEYRMGAYTDGQVTAERNERTAADATLSGRIGAMEGVGDDLEAHTAATTTAHGGIVASTDPRLTDSRTPKAHTHSQGDVTGLTTALNSKADQSALSEHTGATSGAHPASAISFTPTDKIFSTTVQGAIEEAANQGSGGGSGGDAPDASTTIKGVSKLSVAPASPSNPIAAGDNDPRLTNQRVPTDGSVTNAKVAAGAAIDESKLNLASDAAAGTPSRRTLGAGPNQAAPGNHTHSQYAPVNSPAFTGAPTAPTPGIADASQRLATTQFVKDAISGSAGGGLPGVQVVSEDSVGAVRDAIDAAGPDGTVYFPPETIVAGTGGAPLTPPDGQRWVLNGTTLKCGDEGTTNNNLRFIQPDGDLYIDGHGGAKIEGPDVIGAGGIVYGIESIADGGVCRVKGVTFQWLSGGLRLSPPVPSIYSYDADQCEFIGRVDGAAGSLILMTNDPDSKGGYVHVRNSVFRDIGRPGSVLHHGMYIYPDIDLEVDNCRFEGEGADEYCYAIQVYNPGSNVSAAYRRIRDCYFSEEILCNEIVLPHSGISKISGCMFSGQKSAITTFQGLLDASDNVFAGARGDNVLRSFETSVWSVGSNKFLSSMAAGVAAIQIESDAHSAKFIENLFLGAPGYYVNIDGGSDQEVHFRGDDFHGGAGSGAVRCAADVARLAFHGTTWHGSGTGLYQPSGTIGRFEAIGNMRLGTSSHSLNGSRTIEIEEMNFNQSGELHTWG